MENKPNERDSAGKRATITLIWLAVGLAPMVIILGSLSSNGSPSKGVTVLVITVICNILGGFGCARNVEDILSRSILGLFFSGCFFVLCVIVAVYQACSHMQF